MKSKNICYNNICPWFYKNCSHNLDNNNLPICLESKKKQEKKEIINENEL